MNGKQRRTFFGKLISDYNGDLNKEHGGLSVIHGRLTHIDDITDNVSTGYALARNGKKIPFYAIKEGEYVGIGIGYAGAMDSILYQQITKTTPDAIAAEFWKVHNTTDYYTVEDFWQWYRRLTGACYGGSIQFLEDRGMKMSDKYTVSQFVDIVQGEQGGSIISKLIGGHDETTDISAAVHGE